MSGIHAANPGSGIFSTWTSGEARNSARANGPWLAGNSTGVSGKTAWRAGITGSGIGRESLARSSRRISVRQLSLLGEIQVPFLVDQLIAKVKCRPFHRHLELVIILDAVGTHQKHQEGARVRDQSGVHRPGVLRPRPVLDL